MKKRVLFVGNSHLAALKQGLDLYSPQLSYEPIFFGLGGSLMSELVNHGPLLTATSSRALKKLNLLWGQESFDCRNCDAIFLLGMGSGVRTLRPLIAGYQTGHARGSGDRHVISADTYEASMIGLFENAIIGHAARVVHQATNTPVYVIQQPAPGHGLIEDSTAQQGQRPQVKMRWLQEVSYSEEAAFLSDRIRSALLAATKAEACIAQPQETLQTALTTKSEFMSGTDRLGGLQGHRAEEDDSVHANALFGQLILKELNKYFP